MKLVGEFPWSVTASIFLQWYNAVSWVMEREFAWYKKLLPVIHKGSHFLLDFYLINDIYKGSHLKEAEVKDTLRMV